MSYAAVPMRLEHREAVLRLWKDNMSDPRIATVLDERYRWLYEENPEGPARTIVAVYQSAGEIVGCGSAYPRRMFLDGVELTAGVPSDFAVARKHRIGGAAVAIQRALVEAEPPQYAMYLAFPNKHSLPIFQRLGYRMLDEAYGWTKPLTANDKVRRVIKHDTLAAAASMPVNLVLAASDRVRGFKHRNVTTEVTERADERFDRLWERARGTYRLAGERCAAYLNWRYADFKTEDYRFFCVHRESPDELSGYVVFRVQDRKVFVVDLFAEDMTGTAAQVLRRFTDAMRDAQHESIFLSFAGNPAFIDTLTQAGFFRSAADTRQLLILPRGVTPEQEAALMDKANWYMFDGEMDI